MDDDTLSRAPAAGCNSVAWILWRLTRVMDLFIHYRLQDAEQLWSKGGWAEKFNMQPGIYDQGTAEQAAAWIPPSGEIQEGYYHAVKAETQACLAQVSEEELARAIVLPPLPEPRTIAACFGQVMGGALAHRGQIAYLRGLFLSMGCR